MNSFGQLEDLLRASDAKQLPNVDEFKTNEWFVRYVHRDDAIAAYTHPDMKEVCNSSLTNFFLFF